MASTNAANVLKKPSFFFFFLVQLLGAFNDNFFKNAVVILIAAKGLSLFGLSPDICITLASAVFILPFFLGSAFSGQLADKYPKTQIIRAVKGLEILCMLLGTLGFYLNSLPLLVGVVLLLGIHSTLFGPVKYSILPQILEDDELVQGNALVETGTFVAILGGTILGGLLILLDQGALYVGLGTTAAALLGYGLSLLIPAIQPVAPQLTIGRSLWGPTKEVLSLASRTKSVFLAILGISWFWFFGAALLQIFPSFVQKNLFAENQLILSLIHI